MRNGVVGFGLMVLTVLSATASELTITTYNIENYVAANRVTADGYRKAYPKPEAAKQALRNVIRRLNADVLLLQEMGALSYLEELVRDLKKEGLDYPHAHLAQGLDEARHVAILSRMPLVSVQTHADLIFKYFDGIETVKRGLLEAKVSTSDGEVTIWALHLKSRYTDRKDDPDSIKRRAGEAMAIREFILKRFPEPAESRFIIMGDFNDVKRSAAVRYMKKRGKLMITKLLPAVDSRGEHWTYHYGRTDTYSRVDHVLVSPGLFHAIKDGSARIEDDEDVRKASDHRPVTVTLQFSN
jgi:endonuclease/exonuclease/phosphatase family metal-dependent hydrolase|uniref:endonuclease/exonuclease/phosphatase family protein n=1 Tax=Cephaloticoccus sp. TaxID=1985742 RepID=UPI00404974FE